MRAACSALVLTAALAALTSGSFSAFTAQSTGTVTVDSSATFEPVSVAAPQIVRTGSGLTEKLVVDVAGTWRSNSPVTRSYAWQVCTAPATCVDLGTTGIELSLFGLGGTLFRVVEAASNAYGPAEASAPSTVFDLLG